MSTGRYSIIDISTDDIHSMQNPAKFPKEVYGKMNNVRFGFCYSKEEAREAIVRYAKKNFFWCKYEVINVLGDETNDCE